jgi:WD40 repeat protein
MHIEKYYKLNTINVYAIKGTHFWIKGNEMMIYRRQKYINFLFSVILFGCSTINQDKSNNTPSGGTNPFATKTTIVTVANKSQVPIVKLPHNLYVLAVDINHTPQIFQIDRDSFNLLQITHEEVGVRSFDISPVDGILVYTTDEQILLTDLLTANREIITDIDDSERSFTSVRFSPDGQIIAYSLSGNIYFYSVKTKISTLQLGKDTEGYFLNENCEFSPDGKKILIRHPQIGILDITNKTVNYLHRLPIGSKGENFGFCNNIPYWSSDSNHLYFADAVTAGGCGYEFGLFLFNLDGIGNRLFPDQPNKPETEGASIASVWEEKIGEIIILYSPHWPSFFLSRSKSEDINNPDIIRTESFRISSIPPKWTPDGSALILVQAEDIESTKLTSIVLIPVDPKLPIETILSDASRLMGSSTLRWGP